MNPRLTEAAEPESDLTPPKGVPATEWMREAWRRASLARKTALEMTQQVLDLRGDVAEVKGMVARIDARLLAHNIKSIPPMRGEQPSGLDFHALETTAVEAADRGEKRPDLTAAGEVRRVIQDAWTNYEAQRAIRAEEERKRSIRKVAEMIVGGVGVAGLVELARLLLAHHG